jgi:hypothetical protein
MGKVLRVLVVFILVLSIVALTLGSMLFAKRELLKGRTDKLEQGILRVARTLEATSPAVPQSPAVFPERDVSSVTAEVLETPTLGQFWVNYRQELEQLDNPLLDMNAKRRELMSYYKIDPVTSKPEPDPVTGARIMDGPGTMQGVINEIIERAGEQYNLLTATRQQLKITRTELVEAIKDLNLQKKTLRERLVHIVTLNGEITKLNTTIADVRRELGQANERIQEQQLRVTDLEQEKLLLEEEKDNLKIKVEELTASIKKIQQSGAFGSGQSTAGGGTLAVGRPAAGGDAEAGSATIAVGAKGRIVSVDQTHQFVVMEMEASFITELLAGSVDGRFPMVELLVQRGEEQPKFITKVRVTQLKQDMNLAIGDILTDWQQGPIEVGDVVYYQ